MVYIKVSSAQWVRYVAGVWGTSFMYKLCNKGDRTEPCGTPAFISLDVDSSPSTETLHFLFERNELIRLTVLTEKFNLQ